LDDKNQAARQNKSCSNDAEQPINVALLWRPTHGENPHTGDTAVRMGTYKAYGLSNHNSHDSLVWCKLRVWISPWMGTALISKC
jgi:hypothetical protein